jgi:hypothetical protein
MSCDNVAVSAPDRRASLSGYLHQQEREQYHNLHCHGFHGSPSMRAAYQFTHKLHRNLSVQRQSNMLQSGSIFAGRIAMNKEY